MVVSFDKPSGKFRNRGSCAAFCNYMEKENKGRQPHEQEKWFGHSANNLTHGDVRRSIDRDHQGIGKEEGKFATGSINITREEWKSLGNSEKERQEKLKQFVQQEFTREFAANFNKKNKQGELVPITPGNLNIYYKFEQNRYYKGTDQEVKQGMAKQGEIKPGFNGHVHFIVARKTIDKKNRISPTGNNRKEFDRVQLISNVEKSFDKFTGYNRQHQQSFEYSRAMAKGSFQEKRAFLIKDAMQELSKQHKIKQQQNKQQNKNKGLQL